MNTDRLISALAADVHPVPRHALMQRIGTGVLFGLLGAMALVVAFFGVRGDLGQAMHGFHFWMKWAYTISLGAGAIYGVSRLARPAPGPLRGLWLLAVPVLILAGIGIGELAETPSQQWFAMWLGRSWMVCPWLVLGLSCPIFLGLLWSFRTFAPTRLRAAGAVAGLSAGALAATIYCLHCPEASAIFVLTWYSLGILLAAGLGALLGPRVLRW